MSNPIDSFTAEEQSVILELARYALANVFTDFAEEADLSDEYLTELQEKIELITKDES
jgi:hypothetical protein